MGSRWGVFVCFAMTGACGGQDVEALETKCSEATGDPATSSEPRPEPPIGVRGEGYFVLAADEAHARSERPAAPTSAFTRDGWFHVAEDGAVVHASGASLAGWHADRDGAMQLQPIRVAPVDPPRATTEIHIALVLSVADDVPVQRFGLEDPAATSSFSNTVVVYDEDGDGHTWTVYYTREDARAYAWYAVAEEYHGARVVTAEGVIEANDAGEVIRETSETHAWWPAPGEPGPQVEVRFAGFEARSAAPGVQPATRLEAGEFAVDYLDQDGRFAGELDAVEVDRHGEVDAVYTDAVHTNGRRLRWGRVPLARFDAPCRLRADEHGRLLETVASGPHRLGFPGISAGLGEVAAGRIPPEW